MSEKGHTLVLTDRGTGSLYRFTPSCGGCGWTAPPRKRKRQSIADYHLHTNGVTKQNRRASQRNPGPGPKPLTPVEDLPEELRPRVAG